MTIRLRLTLLFLALFAGIGLLRDLTVLGGFVHTLDRLSEADARNKVHQIKDYLHDLDAELRHGTPGRPLDLQSFDALPRAFSDDGSYLQLTDAEGRVLNRSPNLGQARLPATTQAGVRVVELPLPQLTGSQRMVLASQTVMLPGHPDDTWVQAAYPLQGNVRTMRQLALLELAGWAGAAVMAVAVGYAFAGRALRPVADMTAEVQSMRSSELHRRLPVNDPPQDEIDRLGETFNQLFTRLEIAFEAQRRFVADASHELRSPLTTIVGNLQLIRRRGPEHREEATQWAETALREAARLDRMVGGLLALAQLGEGRLMLERHAVDLTALAADVAAQFSVIAPRVAVRAVGGAVTIQGDADRLRQVLVNLVDNALRATREGGEVVIETAREADGARMSVIDTGVGIPPEARARLFDRFYRVDGARDRQAGGTGLGLSIVQALVSAHGGTITLESEVGRGARFDVRLPLGS